MKRPDLPSLALLVTLALFGVAGLWPIESMWGFNHLAFLPIGWTYAYFVVCVLVLFLIFYPRPMPILERSLEAVSIFLFERGWWPKVAVALGFGALFWLFRAETHFLGDGYTLRANYGTASSYVAKWTAPGAAIIVRWIQDLLGAYDRPGAQAAFQIASVFSGVVVTVNLFVIVSFLSQSKLARLLVATTVFGSGWMLLFFGYLEYYPLLWASGTTFIGLSLRFLSTGRGITTVMIAFVVTSLTHLEGSFIFLGATFVVVLRFIGNTVIRPFGSRGLLLLIGGLLLASAAITFLRYDNIQVAYLFLPWWDTNGRPGNDAVLSWAHLADIVNLFLLLIPGILSILAWGRGQIRLSKQQRSTREFLILMSIGGTAFLMLVDPALGMARDWDLMSFAALPLGLLLIHIVFTKYEFPNASGVLSYMLMTILIASSFIATSVKSQPSEDRYYSLLTYHGSKNRGGWVIFAKYLENKGDSVFAEIVRNKTSQLFPEEESVGRGYEDLISGRFEEARDIARRALERNRFSVNALQLLGLSFKKMGIYDSAVYYLQQADNLASYNARFKNDLGQALMQQGRYDEALAVFRQARELDPSLTFVTEGIALTYIRMGDYSGAKLMADTLLSADSHSPGGHLIKLVVAINQGDMETARVHYLEYLKYGQKRSDYANIRQNYGIMFE